MRVIASTLCLVVALAAAESPEPPRLRPQEGASPPPRRRLPLAELSETLTHPPLVSCAAAAGRRGRGRVRVATWNIRAALSAPVEALADELRAMEADVVALQEVDLGTRRGGFVDQPGGLARALGVKVVFAASIKWDEGDYGLALLSRWPLVAVQRHRLPVIDRSEPRIVLDATVCARGRPLRLFNHHADRRPASRAAGFEQFRALIRPELGRGILVIGDLNEYPSGDGVRSLVDVGLTDLGAGGDLKTTGSGRIDYVLADAPMAGRGSAVRVWPTDKSDHHAVLVDFEW